jgi:hypothetical protein
MWEKTCLITILDEQSDLRDDEIAEVECIFGSRQHKATTHRQTGGNRGKGQPSRFCFEFDLRMRSHQQPSQIGLAHSPYHTIRTGNGVIAAQCLRVLLYLLEASDTASLISLITEIAPSQYERIMPLRDPSLTGIKGAVAQRTSRKGGRKRDAPILNVRIRNSKLFRGVSRRKEVNMLLWCPLFANPMSSRRNFGIRIAEDLSLIA